MWKIIFKLLITFPIQYLVESGFIAVNQILTKNINALKKFETQDIRLMLIKIELNIWDVTS